jgi:hypothetical protein
MVGLKDYDMFNSEDTLPEPLKDVWEQNNLLLLYLVFFLLYLYILYEHTFYNLKIKNILFNYT